MSNWVKLLSCNATVRNDCNANLNFTNFNIKTLIMVVKRVILESSLLNSALSYTLWLCNKYFKLITFISIVNRVANLIISLRTMIRIFFLKKLLRGAPSSTGVSIFIYLHLNNGTDTCYLGCERDNMYDKERENKKFAILISTALIKHTISNLSFDLSTISWKLFLCLSWAICRRRSALRSSRPPTTRTLIEGKIFKIYWI